MRITCNLMYGIYLRVNNGESVSNCSTVYAVKNEPVKSYGIVQMTQRSELIGDYNYKRSGRTVYT